MKAVAYLKELKSDRDKKLILRNLSRIMDLRIIDIDLENHALHFLCASPLTFQQAKRELLRVGFSLDSVRLIGEAPNHRPPHLEITRDLEVPIAGLR